METVSVPWSHRITKEDLGLLKQIYNLDEAESLV